MSKTQEPEFVCIDADQWRRDIQAFASTTRQALDAIVSELSNQCSGSPATSLRSKVNSDPYPATSSDRSSARLDSEPSDPQQVPAATTTPPSSVGSTRASSTRASSTPTRTESASDDRLSQLRSRLAERLAKK